jgi:hypothetical protein
MRGIIQYASPNRVPVPIGTSEGAKAIADWLGSDIQYLTSSARGWLQTFAEVVNGTRQAGYLGTGNAFSVFATEQHILIQSEYVENQKVCLTIEQVSKALVNYIAFLEDDYRNPAYQPLAFEMEYLAEGDAASECYIKNGGVFG